MVKAVVDELLCVELDVMGVVAAVDVVLRGVVVVVVLDVEVEVVDGVVVELVVDGVVEEP